MGEELLAIHKTRRVAALKRIVADATNADLEAVTIAIKEIVSGENRLDPLSDNQLTEQLATKGITLTRRAVSQIREHINVPNARRRRASFDG